MGRFWRQEDLWLKAGSLLVALVIWTYVASRTTPPAEVGWRMSTPLEVRGVPEGWVVAGAPEAIEVSLVAAPGQEEQVREKVRAVLPVTGLEPGRHRLAVRVPQPPGGRVVGVSPRWVEIELGRAERRVTGVTVELTGQAAAGFAAGEARATPAEVSLEGLATRLDQVEAVRVRADVGGVTGDVRVRAAAVPVDGEGRPVIGVAVEPAEVEVAVPVQPVSDGAQAASAPGSR